MFELGAIMAPFWQVKQGKYYLDEVQAKLSQHMLFYLRLKACKENSTQLQLVKFATYWGKHGTAIPEENEEQKF